MIYYDFEVFPHDWMVVFYNPSAPEGKQWLNIINDESLLRKFYEAYCGEIFIGYNSRNYDVPIWKSILCGYNPYEMSKHIIQDEKRWFEFEGARQFSEYPIINYDVYLGIIDYGLKTMEAYMGLNIEESEVSFDIDRKLTDEEILKTLKYCQFDVFATYEVFKYRKSIFESYMGLLQEYQLPMTYLNKTRAQLAAVVVGAKKLSPLPDDEFELDIVDTLSLNKYDYIRRWFTKPENQNYKKSYFTKVAGVYHRFGWGGLHSYIGKYVSDGMGGTKFQSEPLDITGNIVHADVGSYYPNLIRRYNFMSRAVEDRDIFSQVIDKRIQYKKEKNPIADSLKIVLNSTYGATKDKFSNLYDPKMANNICVNGQLLLVDLIEKLEKYCDVLNSNTDGIYFAIHDDCEEKTYEICDEWCNRTGMNLSYDKYTRLVQRDVNSYIAFCENGEIESKGAVKSLNPLDYNLAIINKAIKAYYVDGIHPRDYIAGNNDLIDYMCVVKLKGKYTQLQHMRNNILCNVDGKTARIFASKDKSMGVFGRGFQKQVINQMGLSAWVDNVGESSFGWAFEKFANTPRHTFVCNDDIRGLPIPEELDKSWYVDFTIEKLNKEWGASL